MFPRRRAFLAFLLGLLALNLVISFLTGRPPERRQVPYQPFFLEQVEAGNVQEISSRADSLEGQLKRPATYDPPGDAGPTQIDRFKTSRRSSSTRSRRTQADRCG
jgi:cell division protease FtsH